MFNTVERLNDFMSVYSVALVIIASVSNLFGIIVCMQKKLRTCPTFVFYVFIFVNDTICLYFWNLNHYYLKFYDYKLEDASLASCQWVTIFQCLTLEWSAWLMVFMSAERCLMAYIGRWRENYFDKKYALASSLIVGLLLFIMNCIIYGVNIDVDLDEPRTTNLSVNYMLCYSSGVFMILMRVSI